MNFSLLRGLSLAACLALCAAFASCDAAPLPVESLEIRTASGTLVPLSVEIARSQADQEKGYMERVTIPDGTGMIFVYNSDRQMHFWMKNTPHPLSIAFIDAEGTIREIYDLKPRSLATVSSVRSLRHALEVPQGWFAREGIAVGDKLTPASLAKISAPKP